MNGEAPAATAPRAGAEAPGATGSDVRQAAALSFGHASAMVLGGVLALLIAQFFGKSTKTDAFFAAYGIYAIALVLGQTFRLTAIPRLISGHGRNIEEAMLGAILLIALLAAVPMVALASPLGEVLVDRDPTGVAADSLRALWPALAGQLVIGLLAALLAVRGRFVVIAGGYLISGLVSVGVLIAVEGAAGVQGVAIALASSVAVLTVLFVVVLRQAGWRVSLVSASRPGPALREASSLVLASTSFLAANLGYVVCVAVASRDGVGEATVYAYAYFSAALLVATTAVSSAMVRTPKLLGAERSPTEGPPVVDAVSTYRFTVVLVGPALGLAAIAGQPVIDILLGEAFGAHSAWRIVVTLLCLSGWILGSAAAVFAIVDLVGRGRIRALALVAAVQMLLLLGLAIVGRSVAGVPGIGAAQSLALVAATGVQLWLAFGTQVGAVAKQMLAATARGAVATGLAFAPGIAVASLGDHSPGAAAAGLALSMPLAAVVSLIAWPAETRTILSLVRRS